MEDGRVSKQQLQDIIKGARVEVITEVELAAALEELDVYANIPYTALASRLFKDIIAHREPEWHIGDVVRDADGMVWQRRDASRWLKPGSNGLWLHETPKRPLKKLVEE